MADAMVDPARSRRDVNLSAVPYLPGLDGMRAIAVIAVVLYHTSLYNSWLPGGFLGVEVFFVISGYLITLLLMAEREQTGRVDLVAFWGRRARRLLPALFLTMFLVLTYSMVFKSSVLGKLRGDLIASLLYGMNWYQIWTGQTYTAGNDFVPLRHLWSLAVEEQFYLLWPVVMMALLRRGGTRRLALTARWLAGAALLITALVAVLFHSGTTDTVCDATARGVWHVGGRCVDIDNALYLSTITRAPALLLGAAFAMVWRPRAIMRGPLRNRARLLDVVGLVGLVVLCLQFWFLHVSDDAGYDPLLFRGGFLVTIVATLFVIAAVTHRHSLVGRLLAIRPLLWVGTRSYGLYLFHWPVYQVLRKIAANDLSVPQFIVAMAITIPLTEASYRLLETPVRRREFRAWWDGLRWSRNPVPRRATALTMVASVLLLFVGVIRLGFAEVQANEVEAANDEGAKHTVTVDEIINGSAGSEMGAAGPAPGTTVPAGPTTAPVSTPDSTTTTTTTTTTTLPEGPINFLAIGDSVMLGAADVLTERGYTVLAEQSRQMIDFVPVMEQLAEAGKFDQVVIVHLGTNGSIAAETLDALLAPLSGVPNVLLFTVRANRSWTASNNAIIRARDHPNDNIKLIDWELESQSCTDNCFAADGIHLSANGKTFYANLIGDFTGK